MAFIIGTSGVNANAAIVGPLTASAKTSLVAVEQPDESTYKVTMQVEGIDRTHKSSDATLWFLDNRMADVPKFGDSLSDFFGLSAGITDRQSDKSIYNWDHWICTGRTVRPQDNAGGDRVIIDLTFSYFHERVTINTTTVEMEMAFAIKSDGTFAVIEAEFSGQKNYPTTAPIRIPKEVITITKFYQTLELYLLDKRDFLGAVNGDVWPPAGSKADVMKQPVRYWLVADVQVQEVGHQAEQYGRRRFFATWTIEGAGKNLTHDPVVVYLNAMGRSYGSDDINPPTPITPWNMSTASDTAAAQHYSATNPLWKTDGYKRIESYPLADLTDLWAGDTDPGP